MFISRFGESIVIKNPANEDDEATRFSVDLHTYHIASSVLGGVTYTETVSDTGLYIVNEHRISPKYEVC